MSNILDDFEDFWYNVDNRREQSEDFLSSVEDLDCPCPVCSISDDEYNRASEQIEKWIAKWA